MVSYRSRAYDALLLRWGSWSLAYCSRVVVCSCGRGAPAPPPPPWTPRPPPSAALPPSPFAGPEPATSRRPPAPAPLSPSPLHPTAPQPRAPALSSSQPPSCSALSARALLPSRLPASCPDGPLCESLEVPAPLWTPEYSWRKVSEPLGREGPGVRGWRQDARGGCGLAGEGRRCACRAAWREARLPHAWAGHVRMRAVLAAAK